MTKAPEQNTPSRFFLLLLRKGATETKRLRRRHPSAPASVSVVRVRRRLGNRTIVVLLLAFLLFSVIGLLATMTSAYALTPTRLSAFSLSEGHRKRHPHPPTPTPTNTVVPSPTVSATPVPPPSPTFAPTHTTRATIPANATPPIKATVPSVKKMGGGGPGPIPGELPPTSFTGSPTALQKGAPIVLPLVVIAVGVLLVIVGLTLWIGPPPARKVQLPQGGAAPWQRVRPTDLDGCASNTRSSGQQGATTDALPHATGKSIPSRTEVSLTTTNYSVPKRPPLMYAQHFSRPIRLNALPIDDQPPVARENLATLPGQKSRPTVTIRERARKREIKNAKQVSSLPDHQ